MVNFLALPTAQAPNMRVDFSPINEAIDSNRRNALLQKESARQDEELAMRRAATGRAEAREAKRDHRSDVEFFGKQATAIDRITDPAQRTAAWNGFLSRHPKAGELPPEYRDPMRGPALVAAEAGQWRDPREDRLADIKLRTAEAELAKANRGPEPSYKEVNGRLVQIGPDGVREVYTAPEKPDPIKEMLMNRLRQNAPSGAPASAQPGTPQVIPQSFDGSPQPSGLIRVNEPAPTGPAPEAMPRPPQNMIETPYGPMSREDAQQLGGAMLLDPRYQAAGRALIDSLQPGGGQLAKPAETQLDERTISAASTLGRLQEIRRQFKPEFLQIPERLKLTGASWGAALGGRLSPELQSQLGDFARFKATSYDNFNQLLKELSGTAVSAQELARQKIVQPNPGEGLLDGDDPVTFKAKIDQGEKIARAAIARMNFMRSRGVQFNKDTAEQFLRLEDVPAAMDRRGAEIEAELKRQNPTADPMALEKAAMNQVKREFGI